MEKTEQQKALAKANMRLALVLGGVTLLALFATFYFWLSPVVPS